VGTPSIFTSLLVQSSRQKLFELSLTNLRHYACAKQAHPV
jgi:hypothetical protein